jgi:hypothetical protein
MTASSISGYNPGPSTGGFGSRQKLSIVVSSAFDSNFTHMEVYAQSQIADSGGGEAYWVGRVNLVDNPTGTFEFFHAPTSREVGMPNGTAQHSGTTTFDLEEDNVNPGPFMKGQTIFVQVLADYKIFHDVNNSVGGWRNPSSSNIVKSITFTRDNASLDIKNISPLRFVALVAIGDTPQTMRATMLSHISIAGAPAISQVLVTDANLALGHPHDMTGPGLIDWVPVSTSQNTYQFKGSRFSTKDMFVEVSDNGNISPIFIDRMARNLNSTNDVFPATAVPGGADVPMGGTPQPNWLDSLMAARS